MRIISKIVACAFLVLSINACKVIDELTGVSEPQKSDIKDGVFEDDLLRECVALLTAGLQAKEVRDIICAGVGISSLKGLEQFPNIRALILNTNRISTVDLSPFPNLQFLDLSANRLNSIDLSHNPELLEAFLDLNSLDSLNVSGNLKLEALVLSNNDLSEVDLSENVALEELILDQNSFEGDLTKGALLLNKNKKLINLNLFDNEVTHINVSKNVNLDLLDLRQNALVEIDLVNNKNISELRLSENQLTSIDLRGADSLDRLFLEENQISEIYLPLNEKLRFAHLRGNNISCNGGNCNGSSTFQIPRNDEFILLDLRDNSLDSVETIKLSQNLDFTELLLSGNTSLDGVLNLSLSTKLIEVRIDDTGVDGISFDGLDDYVDVFLSYDLQILTATGTTLNTESQDLLDDMENNKDSHPFYSDPEELLYIYESD